jgi:energy-coupling factor transport system permease protein
VSGGGGIVPVYQPGTSALHSARAAVASSFCGALALVPIVFDHPLPLTGALIAIVAAGVAAGVGRELARGARLAVTIALMITAINPFVAGQGNTLLFRGDEIFGHRFGDVTLEAIAYGAAFGLRAAVLIMAFALYSAVVDPDQMLHLFRRFGYRSALTASLATRLVPLLARDASRMSDAARCRPRPPGRAERARAALAGALDRSVDVAAALEVRGYGDARRPRRVHKPWSRHDWRVATSAALIAAVTIGVGATAGGGFDPYPTIELDTGAPFVGLSLAVIALALAPLAGTGARLGVARA